MTTRRRYKSKQVPIYKTTNNNNIKKQIPNFGKTRWISERTIPNHLARIRYPLKTSRYKESHKIQNWENLLGIHKIWTWKSNAKEKHFLSSTLIASAQFWKLVEKSSTLGSLTESLITTRGIRQRCCLSPALFKIYLGQSLTIWTHKCQNMGLRQTTYTLSISQTTK